MMRTPLLVSFAAFALLEVPITSVAQGPCNKQLVVSQVNLPTTTHLSSGDQGALRSRLIGACLDDRQFAQIDDQIRTVLRDLGYLGATVSESSMSITDASRQPQAASLNVHFEEGARYRVDEIEISGNRALEADQIRGVSPIQLGEFFDTKKIVATLDAAKRLYEANGHPGVSLHYQIVMKQGHGVCVRFTVMESAQSD
jgi:outer membrane protein assembly factor BamA